MPGTPLIEKLHLDLDNDGLPRIMFVYNSALYEIRRVSGAWSTASQVLTSSDIISDLTFGVKSNGDVHALMIFPVTGAYLVKSATNESTNWTMGSTIDSALTGAVLLSPLYIQ
jgi:hypothetical protein